MRDVTACDVASLTTNLYRLDEMKDGVVRALEGHISKCLGMTNRKRVHRIDIMRRKALQKERFSLASSLIDLL